MDLHEVGISYSNIPASQRFLGDQPGGGGGKNAAVSGVRNDAREVSWFIAKTEI